MLLLPGVRLGSEILRYHSVFMLDLVLLIDLILITAYLG